MQVVDLNSISKRERDRQSIICDRTSVLGNPFFLRHEDKELRRLVVLGCRRYIWRILKEQEPIVAAQAVAQQMQLPIASTWLKPTRSQFLDALNALKMGDRLGCHCAPKECHCEQLIRAWAYLHPEAAKAAQIQGCAYCDRLGVRLCDGRVDHPDRKTCDRPMCLDHTHQSGVFIACIRSKRRSSYTDSIDLCPECREKSNEPRRL